MTGSTQAARGPATAGSPAADGKCPSIIEAASAAGVCQPDLTFGVGQLGPQELDQYIASLGRLMVRADRLGDIATRDRLARLQKEARAARSPEHVARQDAEHLRRVEEGVGFFSSEHALEQGRRAMGGRG